MTYRERLWAPPSLYLAVGLIIPAMLLLLIPVSWVAGVIAGLMLYLAAAGFLFATAPLLEVSDGILRAGRAHIPLSALGEIECFEGKQAIEQRGIKLDARAWLCIRGWIPAVVKITITDQDDPTPYWLISSRRPASLSRALGEAMAQFS